MVRDGMQPDTMRVLVDVVVNEVAVDVIVLVALTVEVLAKFSAVLMNWANWAK